MAIVFGFTEISRDALSTVEPPPPVTGLPPGMGIPAVNNQSPVSTLVSSYPLHDVLPNLVEQTLQRTLVDRFLDLVPNIIQPQGSNGPGIYKDVGMTSPLNTSMHKAIPSDGLQKLLGMNLDQLKRLQGWATKLLYLVHSDKSTLPNSELNLLKNILPSNIKDAINRYANLLGQSGKYASDIAKTYTTDYAQGNSIVQSNAVEQHNSYQHRIQTSTVFDVNSPSINLAAQHGTIQVRFQHHVGDLYQSAHVHRFVRAEDQLTHMAANAISYSSKEHADYAANLQQISGAATRYQDSEWSQVGQASNTPLSTNTDLSKVGQYGNATKVVQNDYHVSTNLGEVVVSSAKTLHLSSKTQDVRVSSATANVSVSSNQKLGLFGQNVQAYSTSSTNVGGQTLFLTAANNVSMKGSMVFINCGGAVAALAATPAKVVNPAPKEFLPLIDPAPFVKETPVSPGPVGQSVPATPEPNKTPGGPDNLGNFLANP